MRRTGLVIEQQYRRTLFPKGRIPFRQSWEAARKDIRIFEQFCKGEIDLDAVCRSVASNNYLEWISRSEMESFLEHSGWKRGEA